ncbi:hypothetical protein SAMN05660226_02967 [Parapedobacter luteus]|uniref:Uncharacterized protein n=1 Tax=Parapedobacter luteus TaxID=623280 RepID=A0A1T5DTA8_9SPHI|nr:hypothetical protein SAMN05660226_02967 [Parapedobacter luteus]
MSEFCDVNDLGDFLIKEMGMYIDSDLRNSYLNAYVLTSNFKNAI